MLAVCNQCDKMCEVLPRRRICKPCRNREVYMALKKTDKYIVHRVRCAERARRLVREQRAKPIEEVMIVLFDESLNE